MRKGWVNGVNDFCLPLEKYSRELDRDETFSILYELVCPSTKEDVKVQENGTLKRNMFHGQIFPITTSQDNLP